MPKPQAEEQAVRERAYFLWEREGRPEGRARAHWERAVVEEVGRGADRDDEHMSDEEKVLDGRPGANIPAMLTKDVPGG